MTQVATLPDPLEEVAPPRGRSGGAAWGLWLARRLGLAVLTMWLVSVLVFLATIALFLGGCVAIAATWNRFFDPVPWRIVVLFLLIVSAYEATTLFTSRVDLPANLAFVTDPWKATGAAPAMANTGIVFTQIAPWTRVARDAILAGEWPLWNRYAACGARRRIPTTRR